MPTMSLDDIPHPIQGRSAWRGPDLAARGDWIEQLSAAEIAEIDAVSARLANAAVDIASIRRQDFPLPTVGPRLRRILEDVLSGRGFVLLTPSPFQDKDAQCGENGPRRRFGQLKDPPGFAGRNSFQIHQIPPIAAAACMTGPAFRSTTCALARTIPRCTVIE